MMGKPILVTGAGGFIGSHLVEALLRRGDRVRALVRYNSRGDWGWLEQCPRELSDGLEIVVGDICDPFCVRSAMGGCDFVFHLAALISIPYSYQSPTSYLSVNVTGTLNVMQAARDLGVYRVVTTSTSEVYGSALFTPITEEHPLQGQSPYSASKIGADQLALSYHRSFGLPVVVCRPFNTFGPRQSARAVIPTIITQLLAGDDQLRLGSLHPKREFNYVLDTVNAFMTLGEAPDIEGEVMNVGCGYAVSIGELAELLAAVVGVEVAVYQDPDRVRPVNSEVDVLEASYAKVQSLTGWEPTWSGREGLLAGLSNTVDWFRDPEHLRRYKPHIYST